MYNVGYYIGYFFILEIAIVLAIIFAKKLFAWVFYGIGAGITLISLIGTQKNYAYFGAQKAMTPYWIIYFIILLVSATIIITRYMNAKNRDKEIHNEIEHSQHNGCIKSLKQSVFCTNCGAKVEESSLFCHVCGYKTKSVNAEIKRRTLSEKRRMVFVEYYDGTIKTLSLDSPKIDWISCENNAELHAFYHSDNELQELSEENLNQILSILAE